MNFSAVSFGYCWRGYALYCLPFWVSNTLLCPDNSLKVKPGSWRWYKNWVKQQIQARTSRCLAFSRLINDFQAAEINDFRLTTDQKKVCAVKGVSPTENYPLTRQLVRLQSSDKPSVSYLPELTHIAVEHRGAFRGLRGRYLSHEERIYVYIKLPSVHILSMD